MKTKALLFFLSLSCTRLTFAQKETNNWYFGCNGYKNGVTFNSGKPVVTNSSWADPYHSGASTISTLNGRLIFYTASSTVMDSTNKAMPNGVLKGNAFTIQSSLIVPWPDSSHLYFVFTPGSSIKDSFSYSIVNMKLRGGLGDVVSGRKNINLPTLNAGKVAAVRHNNRRDYWVLTPQGNSDTINAYLVTNKGIVASPVKSQTGIFVNAGAVFVTSDFYGYFKLSPDGRKLCNINWNKSSMIADFDASKGIVSNVWEFTNTGAGVEFSPKSKYLFVVSQSNKISQYNLSTQTKASFLASRKTIDSANGYSYGYASMQLASDGKIYIYHYDSRFLDVIHAPDSLGRKARFEKDYFSYAPTTINGHYGLPNFVSSYFHKPSFELKPNCKRDSVFFTINETYELDSAKWDFGDPSSGSKNTSNQTANVFHSYKNVGTYNVKLISFYKGYTDTIYETFFVNYSKPYLGNDTTICISNYITLAPRGNYEFYKWNTGAKSKSIFVTKSGTYNLTVTDYDGCKNSDTIYVKNATVKADFRISNTSECFRNNRFFFKETTKYTNDNRNKSLWHFSDSTSLEDTIASKSYKNIGSYTVKLISKSQIGCKDSITKQISVFPNPKSDFEINDSIQCFNEHSFDFKLNKDTGMVDYEWDLSDIKLNTSNDVKGKKYLKEGDYKISVIATTDKNCKDTFTKLITVLPSPKADFSNSINCHKTPVSFEYKGTKPVQTFYWDFSGEGTSSIENPSQLFGKAGTKSIRLTVTSGNGCSDAIKKDIEVKVQSTADFTATDVCENDSVVFINKSTDATSYNWRFGDGLKSTNNSPKHLYAIGGISQTFNVSLVAIISNGCSDSITKAISINANPKSDYTFTQTGKTFNFTPAQSGNSKYRWNFGDGDSATNPTANHSSRCTTSILKSFQVFNSIFWL